MKKQRTLVKKVIAKTPKKQAEKSKTSTGLTKKVKAEILKVHDTYWNCYLKGDVKTMATLLSDSYTQVGSAEVEVFFTKKDAVKFLRDTIKQVAGKVDMRKRVTKLEVHGDMILVHELCDLYGKADKKWVFYSKFRASTWLKEINNSWKIIHQHSSFPDARTDEGENLAIEKIEAENQQLREAVKRRTIELEQKNSELETESALERVRAVALGIRKPDDMLDVCRVISEQLELLRIKDIRNVQTAIIYESKHTYLNYEYYRRHNKTLITEIDYTIHPAQAEFAHAMLKGPEAFFTKSFKGAKLKEWIDSQKRSQQFVDSFLQDADSLNYYYYSIGPVGLGMSTYSPLTENGLQLLKRFRNVFKLAYRRFQDIEKAEAQTREAQIEAALERVRAQTMAMHNSEDVGKCIVKMFGELTALGVHEGTRFGIGILNHDSENIQLWTARKSGEEVNMHLGSLDMNWHPLLKSARKAWKDKLTLHRYVLEGEDLLKYYQMINNAPDYKLQVAIEKLPEREFHYGFVFEHGFFYAFSPSEFQPDLIHITQRFSLQFGQTYRRYLDLVKAEKQAREAEIELALERVRARTMAMQKSEDLKEVVKVLYTQLASLKFQWGVASIIIMDATTGDIDWWMEGFDDGYDLPESYHVPFFNHRGHEQQLAYWKNGSPFAVVEIAGLEKKSYDKYYFNQTDFRKAPENTKQLMMKQEAVLFSMAYMKYGALSWSPTPISVEQSEILQRFAKVFEQTYTRFLDLQKAEVQAREAQIETSLERVRSASLAMQKSNELQNVISVVFEKLKELELTFDVAGIQLFKESSKDIVQWVAAPDLISAPVLANLPYVEKDFKESEIIRDIWKAKEKGISIHNKNYSFDEKNKFFEYAARNNDLTRIPADVREFQLKAPGYMQTLVAEKNSALWVDSYSNQTISREDFNVLKRVARVFEQTYTRFLDLEKAEAQAREAQIEAALERVRSRSLAMHKSEELREVLQLIFEQLRQLNFNIDSAQFNLNYKESDNLNVWTAIPGQPYPTQQFIPYFKNPILDSVKQAKKNGLTFFSHVTTHEEKNEFFQHFFNHVANVPEERKKYIFDTPGYARSVVFLDNLFLGIQNYAGIPYTDTENAVLKRFGKVFEQSYTRFLDLQKAEAQAREAEIQLGLERLRAKTMAMHRSEDLLSTVSLLFDQFRQLQKGNISEHIDRCALALVNEKEKRFDLWITQEGGTESNQKYRIDFSEATHGIGLYQSFRQKAPHSVFDNTGEKLNQWLDYLKSTGMKISPKLYERRRINTSIRFSNGFIIITSEEPLSDQNILLLSRFTKVFEQTYTRFLDLQKAEAQARESQIQLALERVRAKTMAMQSSNDLLSVANVLREQMGNLGQPELESSIVHLYHEDSPTLEAWYAFRPPNLSSGEIITGVGIVPKDCSVWSREVIANYNSPETEYTIVASGEKIKEWYKVLEQYAKDTVDYDEKGQLIVPEILHYHFSKFSGGALLMISNQQPATEARELQRRAAKVFEQAYIRFLDLQKAEAQAREAQIEAALERVRSRTMAMQRSEELLDVASILFQQVKTLGVPQWNCGFNIWSIGDKEFTYYPGSPDGIISPSPCKIPLTEHPVFRRFDESRRRGDDLLIYEKQGEEQEGHYQYMLSLPGVGDLLRSMLDAGFRLPTFQVDHVANFSYGNLIFITYEHFPEMHDVFKRFAKVFEQTYTRFLDLQKAESQAREAQIEAALERVRGKAMAMHSSEDLVATIGTFYHELELFNITPRRCGVGLLDKETHMAEISTMNTTEQGQSIEVIGKMKMVGHPVLEGIFENWLLQKEYHPILRGNEIKEYYQLIRPQVAFPEYPNDAVQYGYFFYFAEGGVYAWTEKELTEDELKIYRRFTTVLSLTYKRYKDLKDAEAREQEAIKQAALDRVRADIASMRSTADLERITPLIWKELTTLDISFIRCGVFIMDEKENRVHSYLSTPDGSAIAAFHTPMDDSGGLAGAIDHWRLQKVFVTHWVDSDFQLQADVLLKQGSITSREQYLSTLPKEGFYLHFLPFRQGMLYVGSHEPLHADALQLVHALADAFSVAYARYEDFNRLELAKQQIEKTLTDLKQTQTQLIQSEKMASLGELTAGIAHEIQNPLNFVNNFSELNTELIDELRSELAVGNRQSAEEIANDIKSNSEKINHHGKRAGDIVKGMLQHSRSSSGVKEPTDINALADEYLRLAYHGLRAKDKSFNAKFETHFDESLEKVEVVPQDIGRVILNLITNAFYVVNEKNTLRQVQGDNSYEPTVIVSSLKVDGKVEVCVKDNGSGIPQKILDKIFQPFFTTKPTGQGTGLGLSLSYDIVKAHGGELKVETTEGKGTTFTITIHS